MSNPIFSFEKVKRSQCKASILIEGLSGRGKSGLALILAKALADNDWDGVYAIDTENKSLNLYEGINCSIGGKFENFHVANFTPEIGFKPTNYIAFREAAIEAGAKCLIQDSISHAWAYSGGILDMIAEKKKSNVRYQKDSYAAWGDEEVVKEKQLLLEMLRDHRCHIISTVRVKEKMEYDKDDKGKTVLVSLGEQQIMQGDTKYEADLVLQMIEPGTPTRAPKAKVIKSRYAILEVDHVYDFTESLCNQIRDYLNEGIAPETLIEAQRQEYIKGVTEFLDANPNAVQVWKQLKKNKGYEKEKLSELPLDVIKDLYIQITI